MINSHFLCQLSFIIFVFFNDTATTEIYTYCHTLSLHDALPIWELRSGDRVVIITADDSIPYTFTVGWNVSSDSFTIRPDHLRQSTRSEEHTSELQSLMRNSYAVFCLKKKNKKQKTSQTMPQQTQLRLTTTIKYI